MKPESSPDNLTTTLLSGYGHVDLAQVFQPRACGTYANNVVFAPPRNCEDAVLQAAKHLHQVGPERS
jgi:hypothetical protein